MIKNDSIKNMLLDIESLYKVMKAEEKHSGEQWAGWQKQGIDGENI